MQETLCFDLFKPGFAPAIFTVIIVTIGLTKASEKNKAGAPNISALGQFTYQPAIGRLFHCATEYLLITPKTVRGRPVNLMA
jgi:hypothetical protein